MGILIDETFDLVTSVYKQAIREATGSNPKLAQEARAWLAVVAPDWEERIRGCRKSVAQNGLGNQKRKVLLLHQTA